MANDTPPAYQRLIGSLGEGPARENSGIVRSRTTPDLFWMQNDSGDEPRVYPVRRDGSVHRSERYADTPGVHIGGAINVDWEDIAVMHDGGLVVADVGNNRNDRRDLVLYFVDEPSPFAGRTTFRKKVFVRYPDQPAIPAPSDDFNYDCEAVFALGESLYMVTKHRSDTAAKVYRLDDFREGMVHELEPLQRIELGGQAVGADALPDGSRVVLTTYDTLWLFDSTDHDHPLARPIGRLPIVGDQVEAVCFDGPNTILFADEATAQLYEVSVADFQQIPPARSR
ncbi:hypothetical protein [Pseudobythopirellula maris]|uniref:hypothetical protein n=1 Tax=Pseudobythopirellula maris TaxID=2527991 RepID=UPI0011B817A7|nr:hypothetical protein [Pseudobythopirellula maris]